MLHPKSFWNETNEGKRLTRSTLGQLYELNIDSSQSVFICSIHIGFIDEFCKLFLGKLKRFVEIACG